MQAADDTLIIAGRSFCSRLLMGTGKFASSQVLRAALEASGAELVTAALRRVDLANPRDDILSAIDPARHLLLPNTSGPGTPRRPCAWRAWPARPGARPG
jgi:thiazole synthase